MCALDATRILVNARNDGWGIAVEAGHVVFVPPDGVLLENVEEARSRIADAAARIASQHYGYCYNSEHYA